MGVRQVAVMISGLHLMPSFNNRFIVLLEQQELRASLLISFVSIHTYLFLIVCGLFSSSFPLFSGSLCLNC